MKSITYYLPEEHESPEPPEGFRIIGYCTFCKSPVTNGKIESYRYAVLPLRFLEENFEFACIASDDTQELYCPAEFHTGKYEDTWYELDNGEPTAAVFDLSAYRMMQ